MESPFSEYKATELTDEQLNGYFVEPKYISRMYTNGVAFIIGQRGSGKTTLLKHLCSSYNNTADTTDPKKKLGIYYRFDVNKMHSFSGSALTQEEWDNLFAHCFSTEICICITNLLISLKHSFPLDNEAKICRKVSRLFFEKGNFSVNCLEDLLVYLEVVDSIAKRYKRNPLRAEKPMISECEKTFEEFCHLLSQESHYRGVCVHFLFDEYENMLDYQKEFINSCAKNASSYHTFKICVRPQGTTDMKTRKASEILREADDFRTIDYINDIIGTPQDVAAFMRSACSRRLEKYYQKQNTQYSADDLDIEKYFPPEKNDDDLFEELAEDQDYTRDTKNQVIQVFKRYGIDYHERWNLMQMKLFLTISQKRDFNITAVISSINSSDSKYKNWLNNYKKSLLYLCYSEQGKKYELSGFSDIVSISGNVVRYVLEICDYCFSGMPLNKKGKLPSITERQQTEAIYRVSKRRFQQISTIPNFGQEIKQMVLVIGRIFNMYHRDTQLKRFEPNHFSIERSNSIISNYNDSKVKNAIQLSVTSGILVVERSTKNRKGSDIPIEDEDFYLHPILTPYFQISWRRKQKCRFQLEEINDFLFGSDKRISEILDIYLQKTKAVSQENMQLSLADLKKEYY